MADQILQQPNGDFVVEGDVVVRDTNGVVRIRLDSETGGIFIHNGNGDLVFQYEMPGNNLRLGGHTQDGDLMIFRGSATNIHDTDQATFHLDSNSGQAWIGGNQIAGHLVCRDSDDQQRIYLNGQDGELTMQRIHLNGQDGELTIQDEDGNGVIYFDSRAAHLGLGHQGTPGRLMLFDSDAQQRIHLDGQSGNIRLRSISFSDGSSQSSAPSNAVTAVVAGNGLSGGGSSGEVELALSQEFLLAIAFLESRIQALESNVQQILSQIGPP